MLTDVEEMVVEDFPVIPIALDVELRGYGGVEELDGDEVVPDEWPVEYGEVIVWEMVEWVLVLAFDLL